MKEKLAIVGTGIAGMGVAHFLHPHFDITLFEQNEYVGGHTNTVELDENGTTVYMDSGFMVFNYETYPNLCRLFKQINAPVKKTDMSFSVQHLASRLEYCGSGINGLFAQRKNLFNIPYIKMLMSITRFNAESVKDLNDPRYDDYSIGQYIREKKFGEDMLWKYLVPMSSAVWSTPMDNMLDFPAKTLIRFFYNHGFLGLNTQHQWYTPVNGSQSYRKILIEPFKDRIKINAKVTGLERKYNKIILSLANGEQHEFDKVVFASHGDQTFDILKANGTALEKDLLQHFKYQKNMATVHTDESIMPKTRSVWSSWNYRMEGEKMDNKVSTIYWMNSLQGVSEKVNYFVSINESGNIDRKKVLWEREYEHPLFDLPAVQAQERLQELNQQGNNTYFCGSYFKYGFHEDAFASAVECAKTVLGKDPWTDN